MIFSLFLLCICLFWICLSMHLSIHLLVCISGWSLPKWTNDCSPIHPHLKLMEKVTQNLDIDISWTPVELFGFWSWSVDIPKFSTILTLWHLSNLGFPGILCRRHGSNGLKLAVLMLPDHFQNRLNFGYSLLNSLIWVPFLLSKLGFLGILCGTHIRNGLKFCFLVYLCHFSSQ